MGSTGNRNRIGRVRGRRNMANGKIVTAAALSVFTLVVPAMIRGKPTCM